MMVAWMSGLVIGLQNRARRFESASDLNKTPLNAAFCYYCYPKYLSVCGKMRGAFCRC